MDPRYNDVTLFDRRKEEWNHDALKVHIDNIFSTVEIIEGWKYNGSYWIETIPVTKKEELKKSIFRVIHAKITDPSGKEHEYNLQMPELIDDQFFYIGGFLKVPIFQMFDLPIIYREVRTPIKKPSSTNSTTDDANVVASALLKLRTNAITMGVDLNRRDKSINIQLFNKDIPFGILLAAYHSKEEWDSFISRHRGAKPEQISRIEQVALAEWAKNLNHDQQCERVGEYFMNKPNEKFKRGEGILFSLKAAYEVDHFTKRFFQEDSILFELLHFIWTGPRSDTTINYKRIRMAEYILSPLIHKVYDLMVAVFRNYKNKFQIPQNLILDSCSSSTSKNGKNDVAHIIHYNLPYNPVSELASLLQCSLVGPGGFKKENVPPHLRNLDESQFGLVCAADTPDREGCGVINNLVPIVKLDDRGVFMTPTDPSVVTSYPISLVPFLQNDDPTRLQMASNQLKQSILLKNAKNPWIRSGVEGAYLDKTNFLHRAKHNGKVIYKDHGFMIVVYDELDPVKIDAFAIGFRSLNQGTVDVVETDFDIDDTFQEGDTLCKSKFIKNDELAIGQNLFAAVMVWKGYNYEDGIVIAESVVKKLTSLHTTDLSYNVESGQVLLTLEDGIYKPFPEIGQQIKKGESYAKIKNLDLESGYESINEQAIEKTAPLDCEISSIQIFPNAWNKQIEEFSTAVQEKQNKQLDRYSKIVSSVEPFLDEENIEIFLKIHGFSILNCNEARTGKFFIKGEKIGGIHFRVRGVYAESIGIGDKIANRHGNKGVIARVVPDDEMPILEDGRTPEIIINPLGIISRINVGQLLELHMGEALYQLRQRLLEMPDHNVEEHNAIRDKVEAFMRIIDVTPEQWATTQILADWDSHDFSNGAKDAIKDLYVIQPPFQSTPPDKLKIAMEMVGAKYKYSMVDNESGFDIENPIACGYLYFNKLIHRASDKISARSIGPYNRKTSQPMGGKVHQGGHRLGEMEVWAWLAHNSKDFLRDLLTIHSDSIGKKIDMLAQVLQNPDLAETEDMDDTPQSIRIMESYMNIIGLNMNSDDLRKSNLIECIEAAKECELND